MIWVRGPVGSGSYRADRKAAATQDRLANDDAIRSVEIDFTDPTGLQRRPGAGFVAAAKVLTSTIADLHTTDVAQGQWTALVVDGNLTTIAAAGMSRDDLDSWIKRLVLLGGPFLTDLGSECADDAFFASLGSQLEMRELVDVWNGWETERPCEQKLPEATPSYDERSVLGSGARTEYPSVSVNVIIGDRDARAPWLQRSNRHWYETIIPGSKTVHLLQDATESSIGSLDTVGDLVFAYVRTVPRTEIYAKPTIVFSTTLGGSPASSAVFANDIFVRVSNSGDALMCFEIGDDRGDCATLDAWKAPTASWQFSPQSNRWDFEGKPEDLGAAPGQTYSLWWRDKDSEQHSDPATVIMLQ